MFCGAPLKQPARRALFGFSLLGVCAIFLSAPAAALEADLRLKWFSTVTALPGHDVQRQALETPAYDNTLDLRMMFSHQAGPVRFIADHSTVLLSGDTAELGLDPSAVVDQTVTSDERRWQDLTWEIEDGNRHSSFHRLDRLALQWQQGDWSVTAGRQAVSWGSGIVFQPLDLFSPFSPTVVDRDYKAGDDLVLIDRLLANGQDLQLLHVLRRDREGHVTRDVSSTALKWHGYAGELEFEGVVAEHYDERVLGLSLRVPLGQALLRADVVATDHEPLFGDDDGWRVSGIINADYSFVLDERNAYVFAEYFYNDWGVDELPVSALSLPLALQERLERGELFNLMQKYLAAGGTFEWHPLISQSLTVIGNLDDGSSLLQTAFAYNPSDDQSMQLGWIEPLGRAGDEYGGVPLLADALTTGGGSRVYLRWVYYL